jgi:multiple sugar transport system permease protein
MATDNSTNSKIKAVGRHIVLIAYAATSLFPIYWIFTMSLKTGNQVIAVPPQLVFAPSLNNYTTLLQQNEFLNALSNSVVSVSASVALVLAIGVPAAYAISRYDFPRERDLLIWILSTRMLPPVAVVIPFLFSFDSSTYTTRFRG